MKINNQRKLIRNTNFINDNENYSFQKLNHSFQNSEINNKLKLNYSFIENIKLSSFKKNILSKINQIQNNQQKTNLKLTSIINLLFSKLINPQNYTLFHQHFSIIQNKKAQNIVKIKKENINLKEKNLRTDINKEINTERIVNNNGVKKRIENISLATESEKKRYNLSNQKTKSKENIFKLDYDKKLNINPNTNDNINNIKNKNNKIKFKEEFNINSNNNLFRINNSYNNHNSMNKNCSSDNVSGSSKKNSKKMFDISNNRKPVTFNEFSTNLNSINIQNDKNSISDDNKNSKSKTNLYKNINHNNKENKKTNNNNLKLNNNNENIDKKKIIIKASTQNYNQSNTFNNSMNREKDYHQSNISEIIPNKGPVKIKLNPIEKPVLLMNLNECIDKNKSNTNNNTNNNTSNNTLNNIINISNEKNEKTEFKKYNLIDNKRLSLRIEDSSNNLNYINDNQDSNMDSIRRKRKYSEARSEADSNHSNLSDAKQGQGYSRKIRGFNFRNNIKYNKNPNSGKISEEVYNKIKGGSVRYNNNNENIFSQINSVENEYKQ